MLLNEMERLPNHIEEQIEGIWLNYQKKLVAEKEDGLIKSLSGGCGIEEITLEVEEFNSVIDSVVGNDDYLYDKYRFRMFTRGTDIVLLRDPKIISEKDKQFQVGQEFYDLNDFYETGVDVRRQIRS